MKLNHGCIREQSGDDDCGQKKIEKLSSVSIIFDSSPIQKGKPRPEFEVGGWQGRKDSDPLEPISSPTASHSPSRACCRPPGGLQARACWPPYFTAASHRPPTLSCGPTASAYKRGPATASALTAGVRAAPSRCGSPYTYARQAEAPLLGWCPVSPAAAVKARRGQVQCVGYAWSKRAGHGGGGSSSSEG